MHKENASTIPRKDDLIRHLQEELENVQSDLETKTDRCNTLERCIERWRNKVRNIRKKLDRREQKLNEHEGKSSLTDADTDTNEAAALQHEIEVLVELIEELKGRLSSEQKRVHYHKKKANNLVEVVKIMKRKYQAYTVPAKNWKLKSKY